LRGKELFVLEREACGCCCGGPAQKRAAARILDCGISHGFSPGTVKHEVAVAVSFGAYRSALVINPPVGLHARFLRQKR
jgi:hypothetical protein